jgi:hypothetical protein
VARSALASSISVSPLAAAAGGGGGGGSSSRRFFSLRFSLRSSRGEPLRLRRFFASSRRSRAASRAGDRLNVHPASS